MTGAGSREDTSLQAVTVLGIFPDPITVHCCCQGDTQGRPRVPEPFPGVWSHPEPGAGCRSDRWASPLLAPRCLSCGPEGRPAQRPLLGAGNLPHSAPAAGLQWAEAEFSASASPSWYLPVPPPEPWPPATPRTCLSPDPHPHPPLVSALSAPGPALSPRLTNSPAHPSAPSKGKRLGVHSPIFRIPFQRGRHLLQLLPPAPPPMSPRPAQHQADTRPPAGESGPEGPAAPKASRGSALSEREGRPGPRGAGQAGAAQGGLPGDQAGRVRLPPEPRAAVPRAAGWGGSGGWR